MNTPTSTDLIALATGTSLRDAAALLKKHRGSLFSLFHGTAPDDLFVGEEPRHYPSDVVATRLRAARELLARSLREELEARTVLASPNAVREFLIHRIGGLDHEVFVALFLDAQNRLIAADDLFRGTLTQTSVYPREVVKHALAHNAGAIILAHNHPSGVCEPSRADEYLTNTLKQALALIDVKVIDHFIIAGAKTLSFAERGLL
jgi:DNA repair protein RadC